MFNKQFFSGRLTDDPVLNKTKGGKPVCNFYIAVSWFTGESKDGERTEHVVFPKITIWGKQAEALCKYRRKGDVIFVECHLEPDDWYDPITKRDVKGQVFICDRLHLEDNRSKSRTHRGSIDAAEEKKLAEIDDSDGELPF